ncbi:MAG: RRXRR domain-containing protein [Candidatus Bathyarchaeia archaeon]
MKWPFRFLGGFPIDRIPVVSADGTPLMPCKLRKAHKLLESGKASLERNSQGMYHIRLSFNPKSPVMYSRSVDAPGLTLDAVYLLGLRDAALKKRVLGKALSAEERAILDLTVKYVKKPRSPKIIDVLARIAVKIKMALISPLKRLMGLVGRPLAMRISRIAVNWGYKAAESWAEDEGFIRFLTVTSPAFQMQIAKRLP